MSQAVENIATGFIALLFIVMFVFAYRKVPILITLVMAIFGATSFYLINKFL